MKISHGAILAVYFSANPAEVQHGAQWYKQAQTIAQTIANSYSLSLQTVAGVIAALSPNNRWERNVSDADLLCKLHVSGGDCAALKVSTYNANKRKALQILSGFAPIDILGGLKVRSFYDCIMGNLGAVCIDGHAYSVWLGDRVPTTKTPKISSKLYGAIAADFKLATVQINQIVGAEYKPAQIQAITWLVWRRMIREAK